MVGDGVRKAKFTKDPDFEESFKRLSQEVPSIRERMKDFVAAKTKRPPERFSNEHKLNAPLDGISECHLAGDCCLLFTDKDDVVSLLALCTHDEISGKRAKALAKKIKRRRI